MYLLNMSPHTKIALRAREYPLTWERVPCDMCMQPAVDTHHINSSFRWKRSDDVYNLALVCRDCHNACHTHENAETRQQRINKAFYILNNLEERKEKIRWFNYYL